MAALGSNTSLLEVDLTSNLIGKQETIKVLEASNCLKADMGQLYLYGVDRCSTPCFKKKILNLRRKRYLVVDGTFL